MGKTSWLAKTKKKVKFSTRRRSRCKQCGRPRSFIKKFGLCRICFRKMAHEGLLPGVIKASW